jgi:hypothetical protein
MLGGAERAHQKALGNRSGNFASASEMLMPCAVSRAMLSLARRKPACVVR